jgi:hypothetical protein
MSGTPFSAASGTGSSTASAGSDHHAELDRVSGQAAQLREQVHLLPALTALDNVIAPVDETIRRVGQLG